MFQYSFSSSYGIYSLYFIYFSSVYLLFLFVSNCRLNLLILHCFEIPFIVMSLLILTHILISPINRFLFCPSVLFTLFTRIAELILFMTENTRIAWYDFITSIYNQRKWKTFSSWPPLVSERLHIIALYVTFWQTRIYFYKILSSAFANFSAFFVLLESWRRAHCSFRKSSVIFYQRKFLSVKKKIYIVKKII